MSSPGGQPVVCVMGPTASGKTGLAVDLVAEFPMDIVSVDSALVYRGMDIGTAKPDATTRSRAPHRLIDICDPHERYSAARFREDALREIRSIHAVNRIPLLVGGTMLYFRSLLEGLSELPGADPELRVAIETEASERGWPAMHGELTGLDPVAGEKINPNDPQRIQRALEVMRLTGRTLTELQDASKRGALPNPVLKIVVCPASRQVLHERIAHRLDVMIGQGFVDEVRVLRRDERLHPGLPSMRAVGYRQAWAYLDGEISEADWPRKALFATRQLAKRQLTWLRRENNALWYDLSTEAAVNEVVSVVRDFLQTKG